MLFLQRTFIQLLAISVLFSSRTGQGYNGNPVEVEAFAKVIHAQSAYEVAIGEKIRSISEALINEQNVRISEEHRKILEQMRKDIIYVLKCLRTANEDLVYKEHLIKKLWAKASQLKRAKVTSENIAALWDLIAVLNISPDTLKSINGDLSQKVKAIPPEAFRARQEAVAYFEWKRAVEDDLYEEAWMLDAKEELEEKGLPLVPYPSVGSQSLNPRLWARQRHAIYRVVTSHFRQQKVGAGFKEGTLADLIYFVTSNDLSFDPNFINTQTEVRGQVLVFSKIDDLVKAQLEVLWLRREKLLELFNKISLPDAQILQQNPQVLTELSRLVRQLRFTARDVPNAIEEGLDDLSKGINGAGSAIGVGLNLAAGGLGKTAHDLFQQAAGLLGKLAGGGTAP